MYPVRLMHIGKPVMNFLLVMLNFFAMCYGSRRYERI